VLHATILLQPSVQLQYFHARLAGVTAEIPPTWQWAGSQL